MRHLDSNPCFAGAPKHGAQAAKHAYSSNKSQCKGMARNRMQLSMHKHDDHNMKTWPWHA
eukprot:1137260-Pelagomonas_calceolata.AAC.10